MLDPDKEKHEKNSKETWELRILPLSSLWIDVSKDLRIHSKKNIESIKRSLLKNGYQQNLTVVYNPNPMNSNETWEVKHGRLRFRGGKEATKKDPSLKYAPCRIRQQYSDLKELVLQYEENKIRKQHTPLEDLNFLAQVKAFYEAKISKINQGKLTKKEANLYFFENFKINPDKVFSTGWKKRYFSEDETQDKAWIIPFEKIIESHLEIKKSLAYVIKDVLEGLIKNLFTQEELLKYDKREYSARILKKTFKIREKKLNSVEEKHIKEEKSELKKNFNSAIPKKINEKNKEVASSEIITQEEPRNDKLTLFKAKKEGINTEITTNPNINNQIDENKEETLDNHKEKRFKQKTAAKTKIVDEVQDKKIVNAFKYWINNRVELFYKSFRKRFIQLDQIEQIPELLDNLKEFYSDIKIRLKNIYGDTPISKKEIKEEQSPGEVIKKCNDCSAYGLKKECLDFYNFTICPKCMSKVLVKNKGDIVVLYDPDKTLCYDSPDLINEITEELISEDPNILNEYKQNTDTLRNFGKRIMEKTEGIANMDNAVKIIQDYLKNKYKI
jgi:DNA-directed RNA polymerase subunit RPC12/RpoP